MPPPPSKAEDASSAIKASGMATGAACSEGAASAGAAGGRTGVPEEPMSGVLEIEAEDGVF